MEVLYNCSCKRSHPFSCMWEEKRYITHCEFGCAEWAKSDQLDTFFVITICSTYPIGIPAHDRFVRLKTWLLVIFFPQFYFCLGSLCSAFDISLFQGSNSINRNQFNTGLVIHEIWDWIYRAICSWQKNIQFTRLNFMFFVAALL